MNRIAGSRAVSPPIDEAAFDPIEARLRADVRATIAAMFEKGRAWRISDTLEADFCSRHPTRRSTSPARRKS